MKTGLTTGTEKYYLLLPRTEVDLLKNISEAAVTINNLRNNLFEIMAGQSFITSYFNYKLEPNHIVLGHSFRNLHSEYFRRGEVDSIQDEQAYLQNLLKNVLYWNGKQWVNKSSMSNSW